MANHVFGSVLCSPGCFSLYRCQAVRDILPTYATGVNHAFEFLTKDMGTFMKVCFTAQRGQNVEDDPLKRATEIAAFVSLFLLQGLVH